MKNKPYPAIAAALGMLVLIIDSKTALQGAQTGIDLCIRTVIPSLFPFFLLSILLTSSFLGSRQPWLRPLGKLCGIPEGAESILISALLGGYPVGAQAIASAYHSGQLYKSDAERMLAFCNNAGPAFLFGMVTSMFPEKGTAWLLWGIHVASAISVAVLMPGKSANAVELAAQSNISLTDSLDRAIRVMAMVCGWVTLFRVVIAFLERWVLWLLPMTAQVVVSGILELSNGCCALWKIADMNTRLLVCSGILSFGGLCVTMQTASVTSGLSLKRYFLGKGIQTLISLFLTAAVVCGVWIPCCALLAIFAVILRKTQNRGSNPAAVGV